MTFEFVPIVMMSMVTFNLVQSHGGGIFLETQIAKSVLLMSSRLIMLCGTTGWGGLKLK